MSMNLHLVAEREVTVVKTGKQRKQEIYFDLWQTPTVVTNEIMGKSDVKQAYIDWVTSMSETEKIPVYADDDLFGDHDPIGFEEVNTGVDHVTELNAWIKECENEGYEIEFYSM